ncbi:restriction endonuclease subunit S [uncultured Granulicatella sp.]|uniref:restriction endonuclease subunit S n=1 Tax=uncultured Granulicatella sp. TaxID=316089 RepID=UPI0028DCA3C9|nr:restriction endonuclease subunit S [uncultured Granulicatella sp.]
MTNILELLKNEKVEWKKIQDISKRIVSGGTPNRSNTKFYGGSIPWLRTQEVDFNEIYSTELYITEEGLANSSATLIEPNTIIVAMYGATAGKVALTKIPLTTNQACCNIEVNKEVIKYRYVYYWLVNNYKVLKSMGQGSQSNINSSIIKNFPIPIPNLETQEKIVEILDKFTNYVIELQSELQSRIKQYNYYRDMLLSEEYIKKITKDMEESLKQNNIKNEKLFKSISVEWKKLGEVCDIIRGVRVTKKELLSKGFPVVSGGTGYMGYIDKYNRESETITIAQYGTAGYVNFQKEKFWANDICFSVIPTENINNKYLYYFLINKQEYLYEISNRTATPYSISKDKILNMNIFLPPLHVQQHIVSILDKFDTLVHDIKVGLPKEIELRQKQYEYWREQLLSFNR